MSLLFRCGIHYVLQHYSYAYIKKKPDIYFHYKANSRSELLRTYHFRCILLRHSTRVKWGNKHQTFNLSDHCLIWSLFVDQHTVPHKCMHAHTLFWITAVTQKIGPWPLFLDIYQNLILSLSYCRYTCAVEQTRRNQAGDYFISATASFHISRKCYTC